MEELIIQEYLDGNQFLNYYKNILSIIEDQLISFLLIIILQLEVEEKRKHLLKNKSFK